MNPISIIVYLNKYQFSDTHLRMYWIYLQNGTKLVKICKTVRFSLPDVLQIFLTNSLNGCWVITISIFTDFTRTFMERDDLDRWNNWKNVEEMVPMFSITWMKISAQFQLFSLHRFKEINYNSRKLWIQGIFTAKSLANNAWESICKVKGTFLGVKIRLQLSFEFLTSRFTMRKT